MPTLSTAWLSSTSAKNRGSSFRRTWVIGISFLPMLDEWTEVFAVPGSRTTGGSAQTYAITGPGWSGSLRSGVKELKSPTNIVWLIGRINDGIKKVNGWLFDADTGNYGTDYLNRAVYRGRAWCKPPTGCCLSDVPQGCPWEGLRRSEQLRHALSETSSAGRRRANSRLFVTLGV